MKFSETLNNSALSKASNNLIGLSKARSLFKYVQVVLNYIQF